MTFYIETLNPIAECGLELFPKSNYAINTKTNTPDALLVRSCPMHEPLTPNSVQIIGRAGAGTNNIPIEKMAQRGIPVLNTPGANANAVKELVITGLLMASRNICAAWDYGKTLTGDDKALHQQVEKNKKRFSGSELPGKTLAVIGLGNIGVKVANAAIALGMNVIGFDQAISIKNAWELSSKIQRAGSLAEALGQADFVTLHVPLMDATRHLINEASIAMIQPGAIVLNFSRDLIVDSQAITAALDTGHLNYYVCDFINNQIKANPKVISLPHLGASTKEAEDNCARMIVTQVKNYLEDGNIQHAVNFPDVELARADSYRLTIANKNVPNMIAQLSSVVSSANINIIDMLNQSHQDVAYTLIDISEKANAILLEELRAISGVIMVRELPPPR